MRIFTYTSILLHTHTCSQDADIFVGKFSSGVSRLIAELGRQTMRRNTHAQSHLPTKFTT